MGMAPPPLRYAVQGFAPLRRRNLQHSASIPVWVEIYVLICLVWSMPNKKTGVALSHDTRFVATNSVTGS